MKEQKLANVFVVIALITALLSIGCKQPTSFSSDATATRITISGVTVTSKGTPSADWKATVPGQIYLTDAQLKNATVSVSATSGSHVYYARGATGAEPVFIAEPVFTFEHDDSLYVEVFSPNLDSFLIYQIKIHKTTPLLTDITLIEETIVDGKPVVVTRSAKTLGVPAVSYNESQIGEIWLGTSQVGKSLRVGGKSELDNTTYRVAKAAGSTEPVFSGEFSDAASGFEDKISNVQNGDFVYVECKSGENNGETVVYKLKVVEKNDSRELRSVTINGMSMTIGVLGTHSFPGQEYYGNYTGGAQLATTGNRSMYSAANADALTSVKVVTTPTVLTTRVAYGHTTNKLDYLIEFINLSGTFTRLEHGEYIALKVTSEIGDDGWYVFRVSVGNSIAEVTSATVAGKSVSFTDAISPVWGSLPAASFKEVTLTSAEATAALFEIKASAESTGATVKFGKGVSGFFGISIPFDENMKENNTHFRVANNDMIVIRIVSESELTTQYYGIKTLVQ